MTSPVTGSLVIISLVRDRTKAERGVGIQATSRGGRMSLEDVGGPLELRRDIHTPYGKEWERFRTVQSPVGSL